MRMKKRVNKMEIDDIEKLEMDAVEIDPKRY